MLSVECFGLSSNNITYAVMGDAMSYWDFFEAEDGWGRVPVWGFATVCVLGARRASRGHPGLRLPADVDRA